MTTKNPAFAQWEETVLKKMLDKGPERVAEFKTGGSGLPVPRVALPENIDQPYLDQLGFPGQYPFTRGVQPTMYRGRFWSMRQYAGFSTAEESNKRYRYLLDQGSMGLSVAFDLPTQIGYDSDDPMSKGEVGKVGVAVDSLADMEILFSGIPLDKVSTSMTINAPASVLLAFYIACAEKQGVTPDKIEGTIQNDVLKEYIARGTYIFPPRPSIRLITDIFGWCSKNAPKFNTISISGYHIREAGSSAVQEIAFTLADACCYIQAAIDSGLDVDSFGPRLAFFFNGSSDVLEEVAKFRAARRLYAKIMRDRFKAKKPQSQMLRFHTQTAGYSLTAQQIDNNIVRVAMQTMAAVLGGTQSLHTNSRDEALALPTEDSVRIALRTQQIVAYESGIANTVDPLAGSYYIEQLTDKLEAEAAALMKKIDDMGGMIPAIEAGFVQRQIEDSAYDYQNQIEKGERIIVGVNKFQIKEQVSPPVFRVDASVGENQAQKLKELRAKRDNARVQQCLEAIEKAAKGTDNLMPPIIDAARAYATLGEVCNVLRKVFGTYSDVRAH